MRYEYVIQTFMLGQFKDDEEHRPYGNYWDAVGAALEEARIYGRDVRVFKRPVSAGEVVFAISGEEI